MTLPRLLPLLSPFLLAAAVGCAPKPLARPELAPRIRTPGAQKTAADAESRGGDDEGDRERPQPGVESK